MWKGGGKGKGKGHVRGREKGGDDICVFVVISLKLPSIKVGWVSVSVFTFKESTVTESRPPSRIHLVTG